MNEHVAPTAAVEVTGIALEERVTRVCVVLALERGVADRTVRRRIAVHPTVNHRSEHAGVVRAGTLESAHRLIVVPIGGLCALIVSDARANAGRDLRRWLDEVTPSGGARGQQLS